MSSEATGSKAAGAEATNPGNTRPGSTGSDPGSSEATLPAAAANVIQLPLDTVAIQKMLPHRYPFLLVDRVVEFEPNQRVLCYKNVSCNEPFFQGHFPGQPVMPGVLVLEALAQAGGILTQLSHQSGIDGKLFYLVKIDGAKFSKMVVPGDRLDLDISLKRTIRNMALYAGVARVDGKQVACADILCAEVKV